MFVVRLLTFPFRWGWRNRRVLSLTALGLFLVAAVALAVWNPWGMVWGFLRGEKFHSYKAASYWKKKFAAGWDEETYGRRTCIDYWDFFKDGSPILCDFLADPDVNVRRVAAAQLRIDGTKNPNTVAPLRTAMADDDFWVRMLATEALSRRDELVRDAYPDFLRLADDPDERMRHRAEMGLWAADPERTAERQGWVTFRSDAFGITARFPKRPVESVVRKIDQDQLLGYRRFEARLPDGILLIEVFDPSLTEDVHTALEDFSLISDRVSPMRHDVLEDFQVGGQGQLGRGPNGEPFIIMLEQGKHPKLGVVRIYTYSFGESGSGSEKQLDALAVDSAVNRNLPARLGMLRYFTDSVVVDRPAKADKE